MVSLRIGCLSSMFIVSEGHRMKTLSPWPALKFHAQVEQASIWRPVWLRSGPRYIRVESGACACMDESKLSESLAFK